MLVITLKRWGFKAMTERFNSTVLAAVMLLTGCSLIPVYERPVAPLPEHYPSQRGALPAQPNSAAIPWKEFFLDHQLQRLIDIALTHNRDLRVAALNIQQMRAQLQIRDADRFPSVGLAANAIRGPSVNNGALKNSFSVGAVVSAWELDFFGRLASLKEQALAQYLATEEARNAVQVSLIASVASGWFSLLAGEELLDLSRRTLATREESLKLMRLRLDAGAASELDYRQAEALTEAARATLAQQTRQRAQDENALVLLLGRPLPDDIYVSAPGSKLPDLSSMASLPSGAPSELLTRRPDIRQAEQQLIAANANIGAARAAFFPRIALTAQAGNTSEELSRLFEGGAWGFTLAPSLLLPIFDAGRNQANLQVSQTARDIAVAQYEKSIQTAFREVSDALMSQSAIADLASAYRAQAAAEAERVRLSTLRYGTGVSSYLDLLDAQRSLFAVEQSFVQVRLAQMQNQVTLYKALGGGSGGATLSPPSVSKFE